MLRIKPRNLRAACRGAAPFAAAVLAVAWAAHALPAVRAGAAQGRAGQISVRVAPDRADWTYELGRPVKFRISVIRDGHPVPGASVSYRVGPEMMPPTLEQTSAVPPEGLVVEAGTMRVPGFLRCAVAYEAGGKTYHGLATAGFAPGEIGATAEEPTDFDEFWRAGREALARIPLDARLTPLPEYSTANSNVYQVSFQNVGGDGDRPSRVYGILSEPKADGRYPAVLEVPGAGIRPYRGRADLADRGVISLQIGIHGLPVTLEQSVYDSLGRAAVAGYWTFNLDSRERYYYRRVYLGCLRANDFLTSLPKWDGKNLAVTGYSQGGALSIVTAALDSRVRGLAAFYPALSDLTGYLHGRAGGWPHVFRDAGPGSHRTREKIETSKYYDVVNFARRLRVPGYYTWGFNDEVCPPTSMYAAYNVIKAPKELLLALETGHFVVPEQPERLNRWLEELLKGGAR